MISTGKKENWKNAVIFCGDKEKKAADLYWIDTGRGWKYRMEQKEGNVLHICFEHGPDIRQLRESMVGAAYAMKQAGVTEYGVDVESIRNISARPCLMAVAEGACMGNYKITLPGKAGGRLPDVTVDGIADIEDADLKEAVCLAETQTWVRDLVNAPGNMLRPMDFARAVMMKMENVPVECELLVCGTLNDIGMHALTGVGGSSENPSCMLILRYRGADGEPVAGLVGKGVTCDTGGYCLKSAKSMQGIKGDMAGGASVAGAVYALASQRARINVTAVIPMCENRIGPLSLVPGDVIDSYSGKLIEIRDTDAEGRLIMGDAVSWLVQNENVSFVLDIATLTGSVVSALGFTTAGVVSDNEKLFEDFMRGAQVSGERYWRLPFYEEQEEMLKSSIADIRNLGEDYCGTITAGPFVRAFAQQKPWIHLDIAGTAWTDKPLYPGQPSGATGAGMTSIYHMLAGGEKTCFQK